MTYETAGRSSSVVEQSIRNRQVVGSTPTFGSTPLWVRPGELGKSTSDTSSHPCVRPLNSQSIAHELFLAAFPNQAQSRDESIPRSKSRGLKGIDGSKNRRHSRIFFVCK